MKKFGLVAVTGLLLGATMVTPASAQGAGGSCGSSPGQAAKNNTVVTSGPASTKAQMGLRSATDKFGSNRVLIFWNATGVPQGGKILLSTGWDLADVFAVVGASSGSIAFGGEGVQGGGNGLRGAAGSGGSSAPGLYVFRILNANEQLVGSFTCAVQGQDEGAS